MSIRMMCFEVARLPEQNILQVPKKSRDPGNFGRAWSPISYRSTRNFEQFYDANLRWSER